MAKVTAMQAQKSKPAFDPQASYKWEPTDVFEITGLQLAALYHCLTREVNDPAGSSVILKYEAFNVVLDVFKRGVEQGAIVEVNSGENAEQIEEVEKNVDKLFGGKTAPFGAGKNPDELPHWHPNS